MITFIWIFSVVVLLGFAYFVATSANQRKRASQSGSSVVQSEQTGQGKPKIGRARGTN